jgi:TolB-like protein/Tfp pilus assembly protein PilF
VADFGIARAVTVAGGERLTGTGFAVGTPAYMSPEQAFGDADIDGRSDVYALGCVVYEMVSGRAPFEAETPQALLAKHAADTVPSMRASDASIPLFVERAVERTLAKDPSDRFQSPKEFAEALTSEIVVARVGRSRWARLAVAGPVTFVILIAAIWAYLTFLSGPTYDRLAVLPPTNLMNDPEQDFFVQGMHNALISELQRAGIAVIARTSVLRYENTLLPASEIAGEIGADALIESSVLRSGDSVEIEVRLVDAGTDQYLGEPITRSSGLSDVVALYRNLTSAIAEEIRAALSPQAEARLASVREINPQAYEAFLRGQFHFQRLTPFDLDQAQEYFEEALRLDSTYAPAQAGLALVWIGKGQMMIAPPRVAAANANAEAQKALALDSTVAEVHYALALHRAWQEWEWEGAETAFRNAIEINPDYSEARALYSSFLYMFDRQEEARTQIDRALESDPLNPLIRAFNGFDLYYERRYDESVAELEEAIRMDPNNPVAFGNLMTAYHLAGRHDEVLPLVLQWFAGDEELEQVVERSYAESGYQAATRALAETLSARPGAAEMMPFLIAGIYAWAGEKESCLEWMEKAYEAHDPSLPYANQPDFDLVRDDPRWKELRRRMGMPE